MRVTERRIERSSAKKGRYPCAALLYQRCHLEQGPARIVSPWAEQKKGFFFCADSFRAARTRTLGGRGRLNVQLTAPSGPG